MTETDDPVNHPPHYTQGGIECIDAIRAALGDEGFIAFCRGNALKYLWRCEHKGNPVQDLEKADWYLNRAVATIREVERDLAIAGPPAPVTPPADLAAVTAQRDRLAGLLADILPIAAAAYEDEHSARTIPGSGYTNRAQRLAGAKWGWRYRAAYATWKAGADTALAELEKKP